MPRISKAPPNEIVLEGIECFPENKSIIETFLNLREPLSISTLLDNFHPKYHGCDKPGCILVRKRLEKTYRDHYLDIYACLTCGLDVECLRSGWEIGWYGGTNSRSL